VIIVDTGLRVAWANQAAERLAEGRPADVALLGISRPYSWNESDPGKLIRRRLTAGLPVYLPAFGAMTEEQIKQVASDMAFDRITAARGAGLHSLMFLPLMARGVIMGIVALGRLAGSPPFTDADLALAGDFVGRAAVAVDNARLYTRERANALALQHGLLPRHIPQISPEISPRQRSTVSASPARPSALIRRRRSSSSAT